MKYSFADITKSTVISVSILSYSKYFWVFISCFIINFINLSLINLIIYFFIKTNYINYFISTKIYSLLFFNIFIFISSTIIQFSYVIEAKIQRKLKLFYYKEELQIYRNLFSNVIIAFFVLLYFIIISIMTVDIYKDLFSTKNTFYNFSAMYFFILSPIYFILIFYFYKFLTKYFLTYLLNKFENYIYSNNQLINFQINNSRSNNRDLSIGILQAANIEEIKNDFKFITNKTIIKTIKDMINKQLGYNALAITLNEKKIIIGLLEKINYETMKELLNQKILTGFKKQVNIKNKLVKLNIFSEIIDIRDDKNIKDAFDIISIYE
ncbi:MAG: hypothetical protein JXB50_09680 [Spirochaetes bacterium]|nr:hypothetical protein [Spirochaetota bacterium]